MSIRFEKISKAFGPKQVLRDVSFEVSPGEILFILGKSGMGKSVTLKHIIGLLRPDSGAVFVDDECVKELDAAGLASIRRKCGMVFQHPALLDSLSVYDNVAFGLRTPQYRAVKDLSEKQIRDVVVEKLSLVHLGPEVLDKRPP